MFDFEKRFAELSQQTVLCIGDLMLDAFVYGDVTRISPEAPAPVIRVGHEEIVVGGAGNVARNIASLGSDALFVAVVGDDMQGQDLQQALTSEGTGITAKLVVDKIAADDAEAPLRVGAFLDASAARGLGGDDAGRGQDRGRADQECAGAVAARGRGGAVRTTPRAC